MSLVIESLQRDKHNRTSFRCGNDELDRFLQTDAHQAMAKFYSKTYVAIDDADEHLILGYYTITPYRIEAGELPPELAKKHKISKKHGLPAQLVARLAVRVDSQRQGIGAVMLMDALTRCARVSSEIGGVAVVVDAIEESVAPFYEGFGFVRFEPESLKLFIMTATIQALVGVPVPHRDVG